MAAMSSLTHARVDNRGDAAYPEVLAEMARRARAWDGPIVVAAHVDPDGDALGSSLGLLRALRQLGKEAVVVMQPPSYLAFLAQEGELLPSIQQLAPNTLLFVLDVGDMQRTAGVDVLQAAQLFNIDHHGTNNRFGDLAVVEPSMAACSMLIKELNEALGVTWDAQLATPCLTGILTDTGNFRHGNTDRQAFAVAAELIDHGVRYAELTDRLQWRPHSYFPLLGAVMQTVRYELDGRLVTAEVTDGMRSRLGASEEESDDFVGVIRHAEDTSAAVLFKQRGDVVKVSVRTRGSVSAQRICMELGGGGHVAAAGATLGGDLEQARHRLVQAVRNELNRQAD